MKTLTSYTLICTLLIITVTLINAQQTTPCDNYPLNLLGTTNIGIHTGAYPPAIPQKALHIDSYYPSGCLDPAIRLSNRQWPYWGQLALQTDYNMNIERYSSFSQAGDLIMQTSWDEHDKAGNIILTTRNKGKSIKFGVTPTLDSIIDDYERLRISSDNYHTLVDIKVPQIWTGPDYGNALLRFQVTAPDGMPLTGNGLNWKMGIDAADGFKFKIGSTDTTNNVFDTLNTAFVISPDGKISIGTKEPIGKFDVYHEKAEINFAFTPVDELESNAAIEFWSKDALPARCGWSIYNDCPSTGLLFKYLSGARGSKPEEQPFIVFQNDGNVGIGELNPDARLKIHSSGTDDETFAVKIENNAQTPLQLFNIRDDGLIIIGENVFHPTYPPTTDPDLEQTMKLSVDGAIVTKEINVDITESKWTWPDYVFENSYTLMPLQELEKNIKANKKLPEIPSTDEIKNTGINLALMDTKLLKKIEELTLYIIDLQKQCDELKKQINQKHFRRGKR